MIVAVTTTGIYCREGCPARAPLARNVRELPSAAVAEAAGFRPCRRCLPADDAPRLPVEPVRLAVRRPFAWRDLLAWLDARAVPGVEAVGETTYARTTAHGTVRLALDDDGAQLDGDGNDLLDAVRRARRLLDLDARPRRIGGALRADPALAPLVADHPGLRVPGCWDPFELTVRAIVGQQVSVARACALAGGLVRAHGEPLERPVGALEHRFPRPSALADAAIAGMPAARARAIRAVAAAFASPAPPDPADREALCALPGIGPWTAAYVAMRAGRDPDAYPDGDLVLRRAAGPRAGRWHPYGAYAAMHLWAAASAAPRRRRTRQASSSSSSAATTGTVAG